jgi:hypothetical protein
MTPLMLTRGVRATMMLCDHVAVAEGKMYISGGGWSMTGPGPVNMSIALLLHIPWDLANTRVAFKLRLLYEDGQPVQAPSPLGEMPVEIGGDIEAGRPPGLKPGTVLDAPIPINLGVLPLEPGRRYYWELSVNDKTDEDWRLSIDVRGAPPNLADPTNHGSL